MAISVQEARAMFTKNLIDVMQERTRPTAFLRSFFPSAGAPVSKNVSIEVERMGERIAVDVVRGSEGNRNRFAKSTEKIFTPPHYREYFDATELDLYDRVLGSTGDLNAPLFAALLNSVADRLTLLQDKIERSIELQCAQVLHSGIVVFSKQDSIDFKRRAESSDDVSGSAPWSTGSSDVFAHLKGGCEFLRVYGKSTDSVFNCILSEDAYDALLKNDTFKARQNLFSLKLDAVNPPQRNSTGAAYQGRVSAGSYQVDLWTYPQVYDDPESADMANPDHLPYVTAKHIWMLPQNPRFRTAHGLCPQLIDKAPAMIQQSEWLYGNFRDERNAADIFDVQTSPLVVPVAIDQMYTLKVLV